MRGCKGGCARTGNAFLIIARSPYQRPLPRLTLKDTKIVSGLVVNVAHPRTDAALTDLLQRLGDLPNTLRVDRIVFHAAVRPYFDDIRRFQNGKVS